MVGEIISSVVIMAVVIGVIVGALLLRKRGDASAIKKIKRILAIITAVIMAIAAALCLYFAIKYLVVGSERTTACVLFCAAAGCLLLSVSMFFDIFLKVGKPRLILAILAAVLTLVCVGVTVWLLVAGAVEVGSAAIVLAVFCGEIAYRELRLYLRFKSGR